MHQEGDSVAGGHFCTGRVITSGRQTRPGKIRDNTTLHRQKHPPNPEPSRQFPTVPPSQNTSTLPIRAKAPKTSHPHQTRGAIPHPEGHSVTRGRFYQTPPAVLINAPTTPPSRFETTLPIRAKPPKSNRPHQTGRVILLPEGDFVPGG